MRMFGVEEELLLVDAVELEPVPWGWQVAQRHSPRPETGHEMAAEFQQEQLEIVYPPQLTLGDQLECLRVGRTWADDAASVFGARAVALATAPGPVTPHLVPNPRYQRIAEWAGITAVQQLTGGMHVHVDVESRAEALAVVDRVRAWLPTLLALSSNSPFSNGSDTAFHSYRNQLWSRWPDTGPPDLFGTIDAYDRQRESLLRSGVPLDEGMLYSDARLCDRHSTVEIRVTDVCLYATHAAVLAALIRALVETVAREWRAGAPPLAVGTAVLRAWTWRASRCGLESALVNPHTGAPAPAAEVVAELLEMLRPVLAEYGETEQVTGVIAEILRTGTGAQHQREAYLDARDTHDVVAAALYSTHELSEKTPVNAGED